MDRDSAEGGLNFGFWAVAFIDLLGQKEAFLKTDYLPSDPEDPAKRAEFIRLVKDSLVVVRTLRRVLTIFRGELVKGTQLLPDSPLLALPPEQRAAVVPLLARVTREYRFSDGVVLACPLQDKKPEHAMPILGVYDVLLTCSAMMMIHLALGRPLRGGIDVGTATETVLDEGERPELFGAGLVKAYVLESECAELPRMVVGETLMGYLKTSSTEPGESLEMKMERAMAAALLKMIVKDRQDGRYMLDYAGELARDLMLGPVTRDMFPKAREFVGRSRDSFRGVNQKLFERYSRVLRYLDTRASAWV